MNSPPSHLRDYEAYAPQIACVGPGSLEGAALIDSSRLLAPRAVLEHPIRARYLPGARGHVVERVYYILECVCVCACGFVMPNASEMMGSRWIGLVCACAPIYAQAALIMDRPVKCDDVARTDHMVCAFTAHNHTHKPCVYAARETPQFTSQVANKCWLVRV